MLEPCPRCRRHVARRAPRCPFCSHALAIAAVGAALFAAACVEPKQPTPKDPASLIGEDNCDNPEGSNDFDDPMCAGGMYGAPPPPGESRQPKKKKPPPPRYIPGGDPNLK